MSRRSLKVTFFASALLAIGASAYATTLADPDTTIGYVGSIVCSIVSSIVH